MKIHFFTASEVDTFCHPGVYMFEKEGKVVFIGATTSGISRAFDPDHKMRKIPGLSLQFVPCATAAIAFDLAKGLIEEHRPAYNVFLREHGRWVRPSEREAEIQRELPPDESQRSGEY